MAAVSNNTVIELFKNVYGDMHDIVPKDQILSREIPWVDGAMVGTKFVEDVVLGAEVGMTWGGSGQEAFEINSAIAGAVKQTEVTPYVSVLPSILPFATVSRSSGGGEKAFMAATKFITKNNLTSHDELREVARLYGQADSGLGYVSYYSGTYRGASFANGTGTLTIDAAGTTLAFTNGINAASKAILFNLGSYAPGFWVGKQGIRVAQVVVSSGVVAASGKLVSTNPELGYITVDFTPVAASGLTSHKLVYWGWQDQGENPGIQYILSRRGSLFGINNSQFQLFQGSMYNVNNVALSLGVLQKAVAAAVGGAGLEGDLLVLVNPRTWSNLGQTEAGLRVYDDSYSPEQAKNGFKALEYYSQNGKLSIVAHRCVKEGDAFALKRETWKRSGSAQIGFKVPGMDGVNGQLIRELENQAGFKFQSYTDEYVFCYQPGWNIYMYGINDQTDS